MLPRLQHSSVYTIGKRGSPQDFHTPPEELQQQGYSVHQVPRGGETTYHGPGQLVVYPIVNLRRLKCGARAYVEGLEKSIIQTCGLYGVHARVRTAWLRNQSWLQSQYPAGTAAICSEV